MIDDDDATTVTQAAAAATTGSTLGNTYAATGTLATFPAKITAAIQQLAANQTSIMQQFAALRSTINPHPLAATHRSTDNQHQRPTKPVWRFSTPHREVPTGARWTPRRRM